MIIEIRYQINDTYEEIYFFEISATSINYNGIYFSTRDNVNDIWGYDWDKYYSSQEEFEVNKLRELAHLDSYDSDDMLHESDYAREYSKIRDKYNPVCQQTNNGLTRLSGVFSNNLWNKHPPKLSKENLKELIKVQVNTIIEKEFIKIKDY